jgi:hypothetical protein
MLRFDSEYVSSPGSSKVDVVVESSSEVLHQEVEFSLVLFLNLGQSDNSGGLLVD